MFPKPFSHVEKVHCLQYQAELVNRKNTNFFFFLPLRLFREESDAVEASEEFMFRTGLDILILQKQDQQCHNKSRDY